MFVVGKVKFLVVKKVDNNWLSYDCLCGDESNLKLKVLFYVECFIYEEIIEWND